MADQCRQNNHLLRHYDHVTQTFKDSAPQSTAESSQTSSNHRLQTSRDKQSSITNSCSSSGRAPLPSLERIDVRIREIRQKIKDFDSREKKAIRSYQSGSGPLMTFDQFKEMISIINTGRQKCSKLLSDLISKRNTRVIRKMGVSNPFIVKLKESLSKNSDRMSVQCQTPKHSSQKMLLNTGRTIKRRGQQQNPMHMGIKDFEEAQNRKNKVKGTKGILKLGRPGTQKTKNHRRKRGIGNIQDSHALKAKDFFSKNSKAVSQNCRIPQTREVDKYIQNNIPPEYLAIKKRRGVQTPSKMESMACRRQPFKTNRDHKAIICKIRLNEGKKSSVFPIYRETSVMFFRDKSLSKMLHSLDQQSCNDDCVSTHVTLAEGVFQMTQALICAVENENRLMACNPVKMMKEADRKCHWMKKNGLR